MKRTTISVYGKWYFGIGYFRGYSFEINFYGDRRKELEDKWLEMVKVPLEEDKRRYELETEETDKKLKLLQEELKNTKRGFFDWVFFVNPKKEIERQIENMEARKNWYIPNPRVSGEKQREIADKLLEELGAVLFFKEENTSIYEI